MKRFVKKEEGITLIALIITIIVMLILVGVTINVALNGGIFDKAKKASTQTQREVEREQLISTMLGAYNSRGNFVIGDVEDLPDEAKWCTKADLDWETTTEISPTGTGDWVITKTNNKFYIDENGSVLDKEPPVIKSTVWYGRGLTSQDVLYSDYDSKYYTNGTVTLAMNTDGTSIYHEAEGKETTLNDSAFEVNPIFGVAMSMCLTENIVYYIDMSNWAQGNQYMYLFKENKALIFINPSLHSEEDINNLTEENATYVLTATNI